MKKHILLFALLLCLLVTGCSKQEAAAPEANTTVTIADRTVRFALPEGLDVESSEFPGDYIFTPMAYEPPTEAAEAFSAPDIWYASGSVECLPNYAAWWIKDVLKAAPLYENHSWIVEDIGNIDGTSEPAYLYKVGHDLYSLGILDQLEGQGVDIDAFAHSSESWCVLFGSAEDEDLTLFTLNAKNFSQDDAVALAKSVVIA